MIVKKPPMGWNSWNTFGSEINEKLILEMADAMVASGLPEAGYEYLVIDDCWSEKVRDENGRLVADHEKFPHGMKYVADYVHSKGLKFGMYSCAGTVTCAGYPASYEHEFIDAATFAEWGVDYLKYDYCFRDSKVPGEVLYRRMGLALANCGRDILFSACNWGADESQNWIKTTGAHMWRSTGDIFDSWGSVRDLTKQQNKLFATNGTGCFNDMDMLIVGMGGKGNVADEHSKMSDAEYQAHFSIWCLYGSPLMIGCDIRNMTPAAKAILTNRDAIAICEDEANRQVFLSNNRGEDVFFAVRLLEGGDLAIGIINLSDHDANQWSTYLTLSEIGIPAVSGKTLHMREIWTNEEYDVKNEIIFPGHVKAHTVKLYRASVIDAK